MGILSCRSAACPVALRLLAALLLAVSAGAQPSREYDLKAVFLYNFAAFVEWPPSAFPNSGDPLVLGILGDDPFGTVIDEIVAGERVENRPIEVRRLRKLSDVADCHIVFISASEQDRLPRILQSCAGRPVLTVGDVPGFVQMGGMIGLSTEGGRVVLEVNMSAVENADLVISSKLLRVARMVHGTRRMR